MTVLPRRLTVVRGGVVVLVLIDAFAVIVKWLTRSAVMPAQKKVINVRSTSRPNAKLMPISFVRLAGRLPGRCRNGAGAKGEGEAEAEIKTELEVDEYKPAVRLET